MSIILLAIINSIIWTLLSIRWKSLRKKDISSISSFGLLSAGLPLWLISFVYLYYQHNFIYSERYAANLLLWIVLCIATNLGILYILKFKALSELGIYQLAISTFVAMLIDVIFFKSNFNLPTLLGVMMLLLAGFLLSKNKISQNKDPKLSSTLLLVLFLSIAGVVQFAAYKNALMVQSMPLLHVMFAQVILHLVFLAVCLNSLKRDFVGGKLKIADFVFFGFLIYVFTIIEAFLFKELPITLLISLTVLNILLFQIYDIKNKDLKHSWQLYLAACLAVAAIVMIRLR
ncbi:MAG: hypothetical protein HGA36_03970 [Candidatus Moranbacteria bacterium]|nr:hypothetical protein [Candidatus Moranbacteria bacterium]